jgi:hypothetical protein
VVVLAELGGTRSPRPPARASSSPAVGVRSLVAYRKPTTATLSTASLPTSVTEVLSGLADETPIAIDEPIIGQADAGTPSLYLARFPNRLCAILAINGATGSCYSTLNRAASSIALTDAIVDGRRYVYGLTGNDVTAVDVSTPSAATIHATIAPNVFIANLPAQARGSVTVLVTRRDGTNTSLQMPSIPVPHPN